MSDIQTQPVSGAALRSKARQLITNPETGNTYLVRKPTFVQVIKTGVLPADYVSEVAKRRAQKAQEEGEEGRGDSAAPNLWTEEAILEGDSITRAYVTAALIQPQIVEDPQADDECAYEDIPESDRQFIYLWAVGRQSLEVKAEELDTFLIGERGGQQPGAGDDQLLHGGQAVAQAGAQ